MRDGIHSTYSVNLNLAFKNKRLKNKNKILMMWKNYGSCKAAGQPSSTIQLKNQAIKNSDSFQKTQDEQTIKR